MNYNIHPIFVHFPIALLIIYSLLKILPLKKFFPNVNWKDTERVFLAVGVAGAFAALSTGETAEHLVQPNHALVESHALFASIATWIYSIVLAGELAAIISVASWSQKLPIYLQRILSFLARLLSRGALSIILAFIGLIAISITGMLGGIITYGTTADPLAPYLLNLLNISL